MKHLREAEKVLNQYNESFKKPDMVKLGNKMGFHTYLGDLLEVPLPNNVDKDSYVRGILVAGTYIDKKMMLDENQQSPYKRFAVAYLLSEYILSNYPNNFSGLVIDNHYDKEILAFCRDLLLPNKYFKCDLKEPNIQRLSFSYNVPDFIIVQKIKKLRRGGK